MNIEEFRNYCLSFPMVTESFPFDDKVLVFKVANKMFALADVEDYEFINLKCDPERAIMLREEFDEIKPGYHMHKRLWNSVYVTGTLETDFIKELILHSFNLVVASHPRKVQNQISQLLNS